MSFIVVFRFLVRQRLNGFTVKILSVKVWLSSIIRFSLTPSSGNYESPGSGAWHLLRQTFDWNNRCRLKVVSNGRWHEKHDVSVICVRKTWVVLLYISNFLVLVYYIRFQLPFMTGRQITCVRGVFRRCVNFRRLWDFIIKSIILF